MSASTSPNLERDGSFGANPVQGLPPPGTPSAHALSELLIPRLSGAGLSVITAESCTAGKLANQLSQVSGASQALAGGFVVYTKQTKSRLLGIPAELIAEHTAVSEAVARAMAAAALERGGADLAIALTGITGTEPDEDGNPIGRVHIAAALRGGPSLHRHCEFGCCEPDLLVHGALQIALLAALELIGPDVPGRGWQEQDDPRPVDSAVNSEGAAS